MEIAWLLNYAETFRLCWSWTTNCITVVPGGGFEPPRVAPHAPQTCASARFRHPGTEHNALRWQAQSIKRLPHYRNPAAVVSIEPPPTPAARDREGRTLGANESGSGSDRCSGPAERRASGG